jgi:hypothetical protein
MDAAAEREPFLSQLQLQYDCAGRQESRYPALRGVLMAIAKVLTDTEQSSVVIGSKGLSLLLTQSSVSATNASDTNDV